jgi:uncharacterized membrane protein YjgN (DUF898 family)
VDQAITPEQLSAPVPPSTSADIIFQNLRPQFRRLVFRGALLELVTVGFYRFWLATNIRRHIWHSTSVDGDALEYTGVAKELFFGALLALAIFAPIYLAYFLVGLEAERMQAFASVPFGLFFYLFSQFALYRARRYRTTRTIWRGVRFWMTGSGWNFAWRSALWMLLVVLTFGLALPWREAALERFKMRNSHYGDLEGRFEATGWEFFKRGIWLWLIAISVLALPLIERIFGGRGASTSFAVFLLVTLGGPFLYGTFKAVQWRWWMSGIRFGQVSFGCDLLAIDLFGLYWKVIGWLSLIGVLTLLAMSGVVIGAAWLNTGGGAFAQKIRMVSQQSHVVISIVACYVFAALMATAVVRIYLIHDLVARVAEATKVHNIAAAENVSARGASANAVGEGLADSLEIFGF